MIYYSPPHVVHYAYANACGVGDVERLWMKLSPHVYVIERRLSSDDMLELVHAKLTLVRNGKVERVSVKEIYKPVYLGNTVEGTDHADFLDKQLEPERDWPQPHSWWLRLDLVAASERIRFPALAAKINMTEAFGIGELRELYSYDGFGFSLRDKLWGRE